jgi:hypothetical protein
MPVFIVAVERNGEQRKSNSKYFPYAGKQFSYPIQNRRTPDA